MITFQNIDSADFFCVCGSPNNMHVFFKNRVHLFWYDDLFNYHLKWFSGYDTLNLVCKVTELKIYTCEVSFVITLRVKFLTYT